MQILLFFIINKTPYEHSPLTIIKRSLTIVSIKSSKFLSKKAAECEYHLGFDFK